MTRIDLCYWLAVSCGVFVGCVLSRIVGDIPTAAVGLAGTVAFAVRLVRHDAEFSRREPKVRP